MGVGPAGGSTGSALKLLDRRSPERRRFPEAVFAGFSRSEGTAVGAERTRARGRTDAAAPASPSGRPRGVSEVGSGVKSGLRGVRIGVRFYKDDHVR